MDTFFSAISTTHAKLNHSIMNIVLFGSNNPSGAAFLELCRVNPPEIWGRQPAGDIGIKHNYCDLAKLPKESVAPIKGILVSFAPIWLLAPFLMHLSKTQPESLRYLQGIIACSSSSFMTKKFAFNTYDKELSSNLGKAHEMIKDISTQIQIPYQILAPAMVYGQVRDFGDMNISRIIHLLRILPFILLPKTTGLRQPIHASQLASVAMHQAEKMMCDQWQRGEPKIITLGGDATISYQDMIIQIKNNLNHNDPGKRCRIITIPDRLFYLVASPLLPVNPKSFEAIMRIRSNLSGFTMAHEILNESPRNFPVLPLATKKNK